jgi:hypothetical protein
MKTILSGWLPVILFLAAIAHPAAANGTLPEKSVSGHENQMQLTSGFLNQHCVIFSNRYLVQETDNVLLLESWITDPGFWEYTVHFPQEMDSPLRMESWMTDDNNWHPCQGSGGFNKTYKKDSDAKSDQNIWDCMNCLPIEMEGLIVPDSWMTDDHVWCNEYSVAIFVPLQK